LLHQNRLLSVEPSISHNIVPEFCSLLPFLIISMTTKIISINRKDRLTIRTLFPSESRSAPSFYSASAHLLSSYPPILISSQSPPPPRLLSSFPPHITNPLHPPTPPPLPPSSPDNMPPPLDAEPALPLSELVGQEAYNRIVENQILPHQFPRLTHSEWAELGIPIGIRHRIIDLVEPMPPFDILSAAAFLDSGNRCAGVHLQGGAGHRPALLWLPGRRHRLLAPGNHDAFIGRASCRERV